MADKKAKVEYSKSTAQVDLEARLGEDAPAPKFGEKVNPDPSSEDGFVGVDPIYQNAANKYEEPLEAEDGGFADAEQAFADAYTEVSEPSDQVKENYANVTPHTEAPADSAAPTDVASSDAASTGSTDSK